MDYDAHIKYIKLLKESSDDLEEIRRARQRMAKTFPLTTGNNHLVFEKA